MEPDGIHELTAAYALSALDEESEREYEEHLRHCARCREELASLQDAAASLAYGVEAPEPPGDLRERILDRARSERSNVVPLRPRLAVRALAPAAAAAAGVAIGLGVWSATLRGDLSDERAAVAQREELLALVASSGTDRYPVSGAEGTLVVAGDGRAALVLTGLAAAPEGRTYEVWVIEGDDVPPKAAGLFPGGGEASVVALTRPVPPGATVAVTVEAEGGVDAPTGEPLLVAPTV